MTKTAQNKPNRLAQEKSPYLLQHAYNPVNWFPWCEEAFEQAQKEDKPIFLSIGYSTCHWCHVMERESFTDSTVASLLNRHYIAIKVDREERPDLDSIYMTFCQALTGSGGWPLTIFMTPEKKPFFATTYLPKENKHGRTGLLQILPKIHTMWTEERERIENSSQELYQLVAQTIHQPLGQTHATDLKIIETAYQQLATHYDQWYGGFSHAPKFPLPHNLFFLLRYYQVTGEQKALEMVQKTLDNMYRGGLFDHIGYGFARYSTDEKWLVPHFEKMLYDNALLAISYLETYQATAQPRYKTIANKIFSYVLRDMTSPVGAFYSAEDADSEGIEGKYYVWDLTEIKKVLGEEDGMIFATVYDIKEIGNFGPKSIPNLIHTSLTTLENDSELAAKLAACRELLYEHRLKRVPPHKDDKILTAWNGLMIAALAYGSRVLNNTSYYHAAKKAYSFIEQHLMRADGRLLARYRAREAAYLATLDDYAFLIWGLIELYETSFDPYYLHKALNLHTAMLKLFKDDKNGGLFMVGHDSEKLIIKPKELHDGALPSGNSVATLNMLRLAALTQNPDLYEQALEQINSFKGLVSENPLAYTHFNISLIWTNLAVRQIILAGQLTTDSMQDMIGIINSTFLPFTTVAVHDQNLPLTAVIPSLKLEEALNGRATAYICQDYACQIPTSDIQQLSTLLQNGVQLAEHQES